MKKTILWMFKLYFEDYLDAEVVYASDEKEAWKVIRKRYPGLKKELMGGIESC